MVVPAQTKPFFVQYYQNQGWDPVRLNIQPNGWSADHAKWVALSK